MKRVAVIRGDGTGPELIEATLSVLKAAGAKHSSTCAMQVLSGGRKGKGQASSRMKLGRPWRNQTAV